jgi:short-subunit dehydrogenase
MKLEKSESILVLGGSRGLGLAICEQLKLLGMDTKSLSRKSELSFDFSKPEIWNAIFLKIQSLKPTRVIYCAGGGPYGSYQKFEWKDHQWAYRANFECPAFLLHQILQKTWADLRQVAVIGSNIAESNPDPGAAAYCAGKHALKGLITTLQKEELSFDLRLLSPGYMQTGLLPEGSWPRKSGKARLPADIAQQMIQSISDPQHRGSHLSFD